MGDYHKNVDCNQTRNEPHILKLPDIFMISVFKLLDLKNRLKLASVCKKWYNLLKDGSLWSKIDMFEFKKTLTLLQLKSLISVYGSDSTKEFILSGNYTHDLTRSINSLNLINNSSNGKVIESLDSELFIDLLSKKCQYLEIIQLEYLDLSNISFNVFMRLKNLKKISLKWCTINENWFQLENELINFESKVKQFYLIRTGKLALNDIISICKQMPNLNTLSINQAQSSITDDLVDYIVNHLDKLEQLELTNTLISDNAIFSICNSPNLCKNLKHLNLSMSSCLTNSCLLSIGENLLGLKTLYLTSCFGISNVKLLQNFINLNYLNLNNTSIDREKIREFLLPVLPKCEIEFGHEKMLNRKLMWTINGSRNCVCSF